MPRFVASTLTVDDVKEVLKYDPDTGELFWTEKGGQWVYKDNKYEYKLMPAGTVGKFTHNLSYRMVWVMGRLYMAHRVIWLLHTGRWPEGVIDHIDGDGLNNKASNLRDVSHKANLRNTKKRREGNANPVGVTYLKGRKKRPWLAVTFAGGKRVRLGTYSTVQEAETVVKNAESELLNKVNVLL
jgi:hypothetical protein